MIGDAPVRNGQRWQVGPRGTVRFAVFDGKYLSEHVQWGHAVTVHSAQGVTGDCRVHGVLADTVTQNLAYVELTR